LIPPQSLIAPGLALIFDMDGVLLDSTPVHTQAWTVYLDQYGIPAERVARRMLGLRNDDVVREFFGDGVGKDESARHGAAKEALYREMMAAQLEERLIPGVRDFLAAHTALPMAVASNAEMANIDFVLDRARFRGHFNHVIDGHQVVYPKPAPDIYLKAAELLGYAPENCIVFEDSLPGLEAARRAGARVVGLTTTLPSLDDVAVAVPDFRDPRLAAWLRAQTPVA
jgi:beta-phosphoglucomutase family hydrolase